MKIEIQNFKKILNQEVFCQNNPAGKKKPQHLKKKGENVTKPRAFLIINVTQLQKWSLIYLITADKLIQHKLFNIILQSRHMVYEMISVKLSIKSFGTYGDKNMQESLLIKNMKFF